MYHRTHVCLSIQASSKLVVARDRLSRKPTECFMSEFMKPFAAGGEPWSKAERIQKSPHRLQSIIIAQVTIRRVHQ